MVPPDAGLILHHWCRPEGLRYDRIALVQA
jgi:hypothetical protein